MKHVLAACLATLLCGLAPAQAGTSDGYYYADSDTEPPYVAELRTATRKIIGFDFGLGFFDGRCSSCDVRGGVAVNVYGGVQVTPRIGVLLELSSVTHLLATDSRQSGVLGLGAVFASSRFWMTPNLWMQAGVGGGALASAGRGNEIFEPGPAAQVAFGSELLHRPNRGIDVAVRSCAVVLEDGGESTLFYTLAATAGFHWN